MGKRDNMKKVIGLPFLTRRNFTNYLAEKQGIPFIEAEKIVKLLMSHVLHHLYDGQRIELRGFGVFDTKTVKAYQGRHPRTGEKIEIPERMKITFKASKILLNKINVNLK
jgi:integration host factor subunit beta